ncbi:Uncharacterised protein [uncultured archaeon]|nr:Uncharacterised protein [uncultured archaeon]
MQKYDVQQLLRQQKNSIYQSILTILLAVLLGLVTSIIFNEFSVFLSTKWISILAISIFFSLIITLLLMVFLDRKALIKVNKEKMTLLITLDKENKIIKPIKFNDYLFSVYFRDDWDLVVGKNNDYLNNFIQKHNLINKPYRDYQNDFDYVVITDLIQYIILRKISEVNLSRKSKITTKWGDNFKNWFVRKTSRIKILRKINSIDNYYKELGALRNLNFFLHGTPTIIFQPKQIQENLFVKTIHAQQIEYEKQILDYNKIPGSFSYIPFYLNFPKGINFNLEKSTNSKLDKIVLTSKFGKITIEFYDKWNFSSQKAFMYTTMRPGHKHHPYEEVFFEMSIDIDIKKYAFFPLIGGDEDSVDDFLSWANQLIENLREFCDWNYFDEHTTRGLFQLLLNKFDLHNWEAEIEHYENFDDTDYGDIQRLLRYMHSPHFENRRDALKQIVEKKDIISIDQMGSVIRRILRLTYYEDTVTRFIAVETLGKLGDKIPCDLHKNIIDRLIKTIDDGDDIVNKSSIKSLGLLFAYVDLNLKKTIQEKIIEIYVSSETYNYQLEETFKLIYPRIIQKEREKIEKNYLEVIKPYDRKLIYALRFYIGARDFISPDRIREVLNISLKMDTIDLQALPEYLRFIAICSKIVPDELLDNYYEKIFHFLDYPDLKIKRIATRLISSMFLERIDEIKKEKIYLKLKEYIKSRDDELKKISLESLAYTAEYFSGKEHEIADILLKEIESMDQFRGQNIFPYIAKVCFDKIRAKITDELLLERIYTFQNELDGT